MGFKLAAAICVQIALIGFVLAEDAYKTESQVKGLVFNMEQNVKGNGFSNSYINASTLNLSLKNHGHGSGNYSYESLLEIKDGVKYDDMKDEYKTSSERTIALQEDADFSYGITGFDFGPSLKWGGFESLGWEKICIKNYGSNVSMNAAFEGVDILSKNVSASLLWKLSDSRDDYSRNLVMQGKANLDLEAAFSGKGHIGSAALGEKLHDSDILIDEDYLGAYSISKNMAHEFNYKLKQDIDEWLPCCYGGFVDMNPADAKDFASAKGVFDCTCFDLPKSS
jgi:hypothetical protein